MSKRLGKKERLAKRKSAIVAANLAAPMPAPQQGDKVQQWKPQTSEAKARLKVASHHVGFVGPRGFKTPTDTSPKSETPGLMAPTKPTPMGPTSKRFAKDGFDDGTRKGNANAAYRKAKSARHWRRIG